MTWQWMLVGLIEALAIAFLVWKIIPGSRPPERLDKPDVPASDLTKKAKGAPGDGGSSCH